MDVMARSGQNIVYVHFVNHFQILFSIIVCQFKYLEHMAGFVGLQFSPLAQFVLHCSVLLQQLDSTKHCMIFGLLITVRCFLSAFRQFRVCLELQKPRFYLPK